MTRVADTFDKRAALIKGTVSKFEGKAPSEEEKVGEGLLSASAVRENLLLDMKVAVKQLDTLRSGTKELRAVDADLLFFAKNKFGFGSVLGFYDALGVNPSYHTVDMLANMADFEEGYRWLIPEVVREAVRLGLKRGPIYPNLIAAEESVSQKSVIMPYINASDATPEFINETETIPVGSLSFGEKTVKLRKIGTGLKVSDEVQKSVSLNVLGVYLEDAGVKLGLGMDVMAINTLINGDATDAESSAPTIGVDNTTNGIQYIDLLRAWIRLGLLGRSPSAMLSNEGAALKILQFPEFKGANYNNIKQNIIFKTPIPQSQDYFVHGAMPTGDVLGLIDKTSALIKLNSTALRVESERIAERQLNGTYMTITTGFAKMFRDAFILIDGSLAYSSNQFPSWMNVGLAENVIIQ